MNTETRLSDITAGEIGTLLTFVVLPFLALLYWIAYALVKRAVRVGFIEAHRQIKKPTRAFPVPLARHGPESKSWDVMGDGH